MTSEQYTYDRLRDNDRLVERLSYATGQMLGADDFIAEQTYHRGRLATALTVLHGHGTLAGLRVEWAAAADDEEETLTVRPGIALDRLGRLIEVPVEQCIRLERWYQTVPESDELIQAFKGTPVEGVVVDVFLSFQVCPAGLTPALAAGPFDALDAVAPSRLQDGFRLELVPRTEPDPGLPVSPWPDLTGESDPAARRDAAKQAVLDAWRTDRLETGPEDVLGRDPASLFLARLVLPAGAASAGERPVRTEAPVTIDNLSRAFAYPGGVLAGILGIGG